ncbi:hypothetical protein [Mycobacterium sp. 1245805.9]|uniref:DUF7373 family lipoprotein n=1 Tax=Mycobacterium sp. 1245805.9 TaxID=1856862 RepID=UPI0007FCD2F1|nr:hypothetical protein [Mycobacterium sp. 1245805.9]OBI81236.1 hypothetical protein A9X00_00530 [Mycobacterium sp. 1245805.9]
MTGPVPQAKWVALAALLAAVLVACQHTTAGTARQASPPGSNPSSSVNPSLLDPGNYPTAPLPPLGNAGSEDAGRLVEGRRMAAFVVGPWQADPSLTTPGSNSSATVIKDFDQLSKVVWTPITGGAFNLPFVVGFVSERQTPGPSPQMSLRNAVLRFANPASAASAAQGMHAKAMAMPRLPSATPIVTEPEQAIPIPGHPDAAATLLAFQDGAQTVRELSVFTAHGPYVLVQVARCGNGPDCETPLAARAIDLQIPLIDTFRPTDANQFPALPLDPTGLVARTLPLPADQATPMSGAAYETAGALQLEDDPVQVGPALTAAGVDYVSVNMTTLYQAKGPADAQTLADAYGEIVAKTPAAQAASSVPGLPQSHCTRVAGANGLVPRYWCLAASGRYTIKTVARQLDSAQRQMAAQYRILAG